MRYQEWIKGWKAGTLSESDRQAFAHEVADNPRLQAEQEAWSLTEDLLANAAESLSEESILAGSSKTPEKNFNYTRLGWLVGGFLMLVIAGYFLNRFLQVEQTQGSEPKQEPVAPAIEQPVATLETEALEVPTEPEATARKIAEKEVEVVQPVKKERTNMLASVIREVPAPIEETVVTDTLVATGKMLSLEAKKEIVLKPGFHAQSGATFQARVIQESKNPKEGL